MNKLVNQYNNVYHHSIGKKPINADYSSTTEKLRQIPALLSIKIFAVKVTLKIRQEKYLLLVLYWKLILRLEKKDLKQKN